MLDIKETSSNRDLRIIEEAEEVLKLINQGEGIPDGIIILESNSQIAFRIIKLFLHTNTPIWDTVIGIGYRIVRTNDRLN